jgi:hypothetical protein
MLAPRRPGPVSLPLAGGLFAGLALALYGRHLGEGYLADDFLYAGWAREGAAALLAHTTRASSPQMIRPVPGLVWLASRLPAGAVLLHGLSLALHVACALLVVAVVRRARSLGRVPGDFRKVPGDLSGAPAALVAGLLFLAFPLFAEPVVWLAASFDLWAATFALAALYVSAAGQESRSPISWSALGAAGLFALALLSKEAVLALPLLLPLLLPWRRVRGATLATFAVAVLYLALRLALFGGLGGYLDSAGHARALSAPAFQIFHALGLQIPARLAIPWKRPDPLAPAAALVSFALLGALALTTGAAGDRADGARHRLARAARGAAITLFALLPVLPILGIDADQEGSRLLYFPVAVLAVAGGLAVRRVPLRSVLVATALALYWGAALLWNGRSWTAASREVEATIAALRGLEVRYPPGSLVFVPSHDVWHGAFVLRNGMTRAAELCGLRRDLRWYGGTVASTGAAVERLGIDLFAAGLDAAGRPRDWTACERALLSKPAAALAAGELPVPPPGADGQVVAPFARFAAPVVALAVRLRVDCRPPVRAALQLSWLPVDSRRFTQTDSVGFLLGPAGPPEVVLRLPTAGRPLAGLALALSGPLEAVGCLRGFRVVEAPAICRP